MYKITITQLDGENDAVPVSRYEQIVDQLDLKAVIDAVNRVPQPQRERKPRSDAGKPRRNADIVTPTVDGDVIG